MTKACAVPKCKTGSKSLRQKCSVFKVPRNIEQYKKWQEAIPSIVLKQSQYVCEKHFDDNCIMRQWIKRDDNGQIIAQTAYERPRLVETAVPTIFEDREAVRSTNLACLECKDESMEYVLDIAQSSKCTDVSMEGSTSRDVAKAATAHTLTEEIVSGNENSPLQDTICLQAEKNSFLEFFQQPDVTLLEQVQQDHNYVQLVTIPALDAMEAKIMSPNAIVERKKLQAKEANMTDCSKVPPRSRIFGISDILVNDGNTIVTSGTEGSITIPKFWGCKELLTERGQSLVFSHLESKRGNGEEVPVIERSVMFDPDNRLRYSLCGHAIDPKECKLAEVLEETSLVVETLEKFRRMKACGGLGAVKVNYLPIDTVFKDCLDRWRDNNCTLLSKQKRCEGCKKMRQRILRREVRAKENRTVKCVLRASNPIDEKKLLALRKKSDRERRLKNRAKQRVQLLLRSLRGKSEEIASISAETLEERCSTLKSQVSEARKELSNQNRLVHWFS